MKKEKEHEHFWEAIAYFFGEQNIKEEWLVLECKECEAIKVIRVNL